MTITLLAIPLPWDWTDRKFVIRYSTSQGLLWGVRKRA